MSRNINQSGFSIVEVVIVLVVVGALGFAGYNVYNRQNKTNSSSSSQKAANNTSNSSDVATAPASIKSSSDLDKAKTTLDNTDPSSDADLNQLDSQLANF